MNSKSRSATEKTINDVLDLTGEPYLNQYIDEPIDKATNSFRFIDTNSLTPLKFIQSISNYIKHIYQHGLRVKQELSNPQACSIMLYILEYGYHGPYGSGFDEAFLDATDSELSGIQFTLKQVEDYIKNTERQKHIRWVFATRIENLNWDEKCLIAESLLELWKTFLPPNLIGFSSCRLACQLPEILTTISSVNKTASNLTGRGMPSQ